MKAVFGIVSLLVTLAVVVWLAKTQLRAVAGGGGAPAASAGQATGAAAVDAPQQARDMQRQIIDDTARALQQAADRSASAAQ